MDAIDLTPISMGEANRQWSKRGPDERYETLDALKAAVDARRKGSYQVTIDTTAISVTTEASKFSPDAPGLLVSARPGDPPMFPTHWGFGQLASRAGAPGAYLRKLPPMLTAECLNYGLKKLTTNEEAKLLAREDSDEVAMLASVTSPSYGRIWDADVVAAVQEIVRKTGGIFFNPKEWGGRPSGLYASDHDCFMFMIDGGSIVDGGSERDQLHRGFFVWNSEVGDAILGIQTFLFRMCCGNHTIWNPEQVKALKIRHTASAPEKFVMQAVPKLEEYASQSVASYQKMVLTAKAFETPKDRDDAIKFLTERGFTNSEARRGIAAAEREEGGFDSLWLLHCGLNATARDMAWVDSRIDLEKRSGKLLDILLAKELAA